jgi:hypothetical protein
MLSRYTREFNRIYIDNTPITGAQSVSASYNIPAETLKYLGSNTTDLTTVPIGFYVGAFNLDTLFINSDPFIKYTGDLGANIKIEYDNNTFAMNSGYLAEYDFSCGIGTIPTISTKWNIYNDFGSGAYPSSPFVFNESNLNIVNPGDIEINFNELDKEKINNLTINIKSSRLPIYDVSKIRPVEVKLQYPLIVTTSFSISLHDYKNKNLFDYPRREHSYDFTINLKKHNTSTIVNSFQINGGLLIREDYSSDVDGSALMQLTYESIITR